MLLLLSADYDAPHASLLLLLLLLLLADYGVATAERRLCSNSLERNPQN